RCRGIRVHHPVETLFTIAWNTHHVAADLRALHVRPRAHEINHRLLAALERADDFVDHAIIDQGLQASGCLHESLIGYSGTARLGQCRISDPAQPHVQRVGRIPPADGTTSTNARPRTSPFGDAATPPERESKSTLT